ncbi:putative ribonuclease H protein At1g65750 family [Senna tora]|uniref:Putative ribonuclease H protein At1g65750 family n=1 Tax=Senna tora TaxID=362788 RepID=A0A834WSW4_9FABA|nr:putative ribonuclease H protein At1g65750 family [Senna tora]
MNYIIWNSRGTGAKTFPGLVRDIKHRHDLDFLALVETRQSGDKACSIIKKFGFDGSERVDATGFMGGIWCLWRKDRTHIDVLFKHPQLIHIGKEGWSGLAVAGDFNAFLFCYEKQGGSSSGSRPDQRFLDWVDAYAMIDMGFSRSQFTWRRNDVAIRLDRVMVNQSWKLRFPEAAVVHLSCFKSDHNPLWIRFEPSLNNHNPRNRPFRFLAAWVTRESFPNVVRDAWKQDASWFGGLLNFYDGVKEWNKKVFGNIFARKRSLMDKILSVEEIIARRPRRGLIHQRDGLWVQVLRHKYGCGNDVLPRVSMGSNPSRLWRGVVKGWQHVEAGLQWRVSNGDKVRFWSDKWVPNCDKLCSKALGPLNAEDLNASVSEFISATGGWDWSRFEFLLPGDVCARIAAVAPPHADGGEDIPIWKHSRDGNFTVKSCYNSMVRMGVADRSNIWNSIWKLQVPQRIRSFMWLCSHDKLLTNAERFRRKISSQDLCGRCGTKSEDTLHAVRDCTKVKNIWLRLVKPCFWPEFFNVKLREWIALNFSWNLGVFELGWKETFATACWSIWRWRNEDVFQQRGGDALDPIFAILQRVRMAFDATRSVVNPGKDPPTRASCIVKWQKLDSDWLKVNVDGASKLDSSQHASCGGVARDHRGHFVAGFAKNLGSCDALQAELWSVMLGLDLAWDIGARKVVIEVDSLIAHQLIYGKVPDLHPCASLVANIHHLLARNWAVEISHVLREANKVVDAMAGCAPGGSLELVRFNHPPSGVVRLLEEDLNGSGTLRACVL